jgi:hypothetical protein
MGAKFAFAVATDRIVNTAIDCPANANSWSVCDRIKGKFAFRMMTKRNTLQENRPGIPALATLC